MPKVCSFVATMKEHWKKDLKCPVCGIEFKGTAKAVVCSPTCRTRLKRIVDGGGKPEYYLIAKSRGQKLPPLLAEKQAKKVSVQNLNEQSNGTTQDLTEPSKTTNTTIDTMPELTKEQKLMKISELEGQIKKIQNEGLPIGMLPKRHTLDKSMRIDEITDQINKLKTQK